MVVKGYEKKQLLDFYKTMLTIRRFEEQTFEFYKRGLMAGLAHLYMGEEAVATGVCGALNEKDYIGSTHRGHGHLIARGADLDKMMAVSRQVTEIVGHNTDSYLLRAGKASDLIREIPKGQGKNNTQSK